MNSSRSFPRGERGSVLIVALILAAVIGISLVSYIKLSNNSLKQAHRTFYSNSGMNLAEVGLEEAIACFNQIDELGATAAFPTSAGWSISGTTAKNIFPSSSTSFSVGPNTNGVVRVYTSDYTGTTAQPVIVAKSTITQPDGSPPITKYIEVVLRKRGLFSNGLVAKDNITWSGHPMADSWNSDPDNDPTTPAVPYNASLRTANIVVGSLYGNIALSGGEIWGYAKTGETGTVTGGNVHGLGTTSDDPARRTNDFNATFPVVTIPPASDPNLVTTNIKNSTPAAEKTFPRNAVTDKYVVNADGTKTYYYKFASGAGIETGISVTAKVVFLMNDHQGVTAIATSGSEGLAISASNASLNVYTNGNLAIGGNGVVNSSSAPSNCMFWGTSSTSQTMSIGGNGTLSAVVYAPNATLSLDGGGSSGHVMGAVVAKSITMNGGTTFHYDDALGNLVTGNPYGIAKWRELQSSAERAAYETHFAF